MSETRDTVVIDFKINEGGALSSLENTKKSIIDLKKEQTELNKAYKEGTVSLDQYAKESVQLEASLKKQQAQYSTLQRQVTGLKSPFDKLNDSIKEQAKQVTVAGVSLTNFANPATATITVLGGLFAAYSKSTIGAKDLEFASNQLSATTTILANDFARLVSSSEDGEGFFSGITNFIISAFNPALATTSKYLAMMNEELDDLRRDGLRVQAENSDRLAENAELQTKLADAQTSYNEKLQATTKIVTNLTLNRDASLKIAEQELERLQQQLKVREGDEKILDAIYLKELEIARIRKDADRAISRVDKQAGNIEEAEAKRINDARTAEAEYQEHQKEKEQEALDRAVDALRIKTDAAKDAHETVIALGEEEADQERKQADLEYKNYLAFKKNEENKTRIQKLEEQNRLATISSTIGMAQALFEEDSVGYKFLGIARATVDTYRAANLALASYPPPFGAIAASIAIATGLANVGKIMDISLAAGGGSFYTKGPQLLLVGDNPGGVERVDVHPVSGRGKTKVGKNMIAMAGGGTMYTDAAIMASRGTQMMDHQVVVELVYSEFRNFANSVQMKEAKAEV